MSVVVAAFAACIVILLRWGDLPLARALDAVLVAPVARGLNRLTPGRWLLFLLLSMATGTVAWMGGDMIVVSALATPELVGMLVAVDVAAYLDAAIAAIAVAGAVRTGTLRVRIARLPRPRGRRTRRTTAASRKAANDDDPADAIAA